MNLYYVYTKLISSLSFWILTCVVTIAALLPDFTFKSMEILNIMPKTIYPGNKKNEKKNLIQNSHDLRETTYL